MKKIIALLLTFVMALSLCACSDNGEQERTSTNYEKKKPETENVTADLEPEIEPETEEPEISTVSVQIGHSIDNDNFLMTFESMDILSEYSYKDEFGSQSLYVESGYMLLVVQGHFENKSTKVISDGNFFRSVTVNDSYVVEDYDVHLKFFRSKYFEIDPYTDLDYVLYISIPEKLADMYETATFTIGFNDDMSQPALIINNDGTRTRKVDNLYSLTSGTSGKKVDSTKDKAVTVSPTAISVGETITTNDYEFTLNNVELTYELKPKNTSGVYSSYSAESGKVYVHMDGNFYNTSKRDIKIGDLFIPTADYNNGYTYTGFAVVDNGDKSFDWASSYVACTPLETCHYHGLIECPEVVYDSDLPLFVTFTLDNGVTYQYDIR